MADIQQDLAYDLRQKYAEIVGYHLDIVTKNRIERDYPEYFKSLENLFTVVKHKFKSKKETDEDSDYEESFKKEENKDKKKEKKTDLARYYELRKEAIRLANENENEFLGRSEDPEKISKVEKSLREIEMFLYYVMEKAKMFGSTSPNRGL
jgi:hypothetical protein